MASALRDRYMNLLTTESPEDFRNEGEQPLHQSLLRPYMRGDVIMVNKSSRTPIQLTAASKSAPDPAENYCKCQDREWGNESLIREFDKPF